MGVRYVVEVCRPEWDFWSTGIFGGDDSTAQVLEYLRATRPGQVFRRRLLPPDELPPVADSPLK